MAEKKIGSRWYRAGDVLATDAIKLQIRLMKLVGPALESLPAVFSARSPEATEDQKTTANTAAIKAISGIFGSANPDEVVDLIDHILGLAKISYDPKGDWDDIVLDQEFSGQNSKDLIPVLVFILQETLGDFFSGALASGSQAIKAKG